MKHKMSSKLKLIFWGTLIAISSGTIGAGEARADWRGHHRQPEWGRGHWIHDRHGGRLGWWWVLGPSWYFYERPHSFIPPQTVYVQPAPQVIVQQMPAIPPPVTVAQEPPMAAPAPVITPVMYYCRATGTHYPETTTCPGGWTTMTAETPPQPMPGK